MGNDVGGSDGKLTIDTTTPPPIRVEGEGEDAASSPTTASTPMSHKFQPGDHVIRWEMLPIAWPIQIHGIVLSVNETTVVLVDFGLAAAAAAPPSPGSGGSSSPASTPLAATASATPTADAAATINASTNQVHSGGVEESKEEPEDEDDDHVEGDETEAVTVAGSNEPKKASWFSADPKEMEIARKAWMEKSAKNSKQIMASFQKMHPTKKQRLNVIVLDDPSEWKKWKKVNYDKGLFGFGGDDDGEVTEDGEAASPSGKSKWWTKMNPLKKSTNDDAATEVAPDAEAKEGDNERTDIISKQKWWQRPATTESVSEAETAMTENVLMADEKDDPSKTSSPGGQSWWKKMTKSFEGGEAPQASVDTDSRATTSEAPNGTEVEPPLTTDETSSSEATQETAAVATIPTMNPAMAKLMSQRKEDAERESTSSNKITGLFSKGLFGKKSIGTAASAGPDEKEGTSGDTTASSKKKLDLPTADPPKLVLARTRWLLRHGESVLPPYHAFHSNSECIAVFCKTGYWRNIQADVFLHSTAIGNAKTMGVATMGVAASVPLLAPVIAGLGIGMVAAPWLVLSSAKKQATDITQKMTDQFWAQAEPEVFLECIEHWSKLEEYYTKQQQNGASSVANEASDEKCEGEINDIVKETDHRQVEQ